MDTKQTETPKDLTVTCPHCQTAIPVEEFVGRHKVCGVCNYHSRLTWRERLALTVDEGSFTEFDQTMDSKNLIGFPGYEEKIAQLQKEYGIQEAVVTLNLTHGIF